jgi:hypothetical protein
MRRVLALSVFCLLCAAPGGAQDATGFTATETTAWTVTANEIVWAKVRFGASTGPFDSAGSGSPEGVVTAPIGSLYRRTNGSTGTTLYVKEAGTGTTGWVAVAPGTGTSFNQSLNTTDDVTFDALTVTSCTGCGGSGGGGVAPASFDGNSSLHIPADLVLDASNPSDSAEVRRNTSDGSDTGYLALTGGGSVSAARGGYVVMRGNEEMYNPGKVQVYMGNVSAAGFEINSQHASVGRAFNVAYDGKIRLNDYGVTAAQSGDQFLCISTDTSAFVHRGSTCTPSSRRFKHAIMPLDHGLDWVLQLRPTSFLWDHNNTPGVSFVAEEVAAIDARLAFYEDGAVWSTNDRAILAAAVKAIQQLEAQVRALQARVP